MYVNNYTLPRPAQEALDKCFCVYIGDPAFHIKKMRQWCYDQNLSLVYWELQEVADVSPMFDDVAAFYFIDPRDATMFSLKYK
jgi:hypothetical protein